MQAFPHRHRVAAGIERACAAIAATPTDRDNVLLSLSARELCPKIQIRARAEPARGFAGSSSPERAK
jgi:voltage-gated potassium channel Kch